MSEKPAAVKATFADWRTVRTRKQLQLIFEIPLEQQNSVLEMLGAPMPDKETWVAIARLDTSAKVETPAKERRAFCDLPMPQQAALKSNDERFARFMDAVPGEECAEAIRQTCVVKSRKDILPGTPAGNVWLTLLRDSEGYR